MTKSMLHIDRLNQISRDLRTARFQLAVLAAIAIPLFAHADDSDITWNAQRHAHQHFSAAPGKLVEYCGDLKIGDKVDWHFDASAPLDFNIHHHGGESVHFAVKEEGVLASTGELTVPGDQDFCWMWTNKSNATISLDVELKRVK
jgi:hypothetical protein